MQKYLKQFITSVLILSFIIPLPLLVTKVEAQTQGAYSALGSSAGGTGIGGYLTGIAPALTQLPLCKGKLGTAIKTLFRKSGVIDAVATSAGIDEDQAEADAVEKARKEAELKEAQAQERADAIKTYDPVVQKIVNKIDITTAQTQKTTKELEVNDTCLKSIGRMVTKLMLQKVTVSTVKWIQTGFDGKPAFLQNDGAFFTDIAKNEILQFGLEINNETLFPFGKAFMIAQAEAFNSHFAQNAQYSLNELIQNTTPEYSGESFNADFSAGGWNAWTALTSVPANNPLGFQLMASNELSKRLEGIYKSKASEIRDKLQQAGGFLGDERCADPEGLTREEDNALIEAGEVQDICKRWEYVTPGKMISEKATMALGYDSNNLLKSDDLNDAMAAILDALLSRFSSDLMNKGFADFSSQGSDGSYILNVDGILTGADSQVEQDFSRFQLGTQWLQDHPNFNIRTDVTQALIDEQRIYRTKLEDQSKILKDLNKTIFQLDYCIPGPHPGWEQDSAETLSANENAIVSKTEADMKHSDLEGILRKIHSFAKNLPFNGGILNLLFGNALEDDAEKLAAYYAYIAQSLTGLHIDMTDNGNNPYNMAAKITNKQDITNSLDVMLNRYIRLIRKYYTPEYLPPVARDAKVEFNRALGYEQTIKDNDDKVILLNGIIKRLTTIKNGIQELNNQYPGGSTGISANQDAYELALENFKGEFSRLTSNMVTGDDIAAVDNLAKQARGEIKYVYNDLLTGDYGCEQDLRNNNRLSPGNEGKTWLLRSTKRATYPAELWYDYEKYAPNAKLPVPQELIDKEYTEKGTGDGNLMPPDPSAFPGAPSGNTDYQKLGPGFLSAVYFDNSESEHWTCEARDPSNPANNVPNPNPNGGGIWNGDQLDCLTVSDLFNRGINSWPVSVGRKQGIISYSEIPPDSGNWVFNPNATDVNEQKETSFEQTIGVY